MGNGPFIDGLPNKNGDFPWEQNPIATGWSTRKTVIKRATRGMTCTSPYDKAPSRTWASYPRPKPLESLRSSHVAWSGMGMSYGMFIHIYIYIYKCHHVSPSSMFVCLSRFVQWAGPPSIEPRPRGGGHGSLTEARTIQGLVEGILKPGGRSWRWDVNTMYYIYMVDIWLMYGYYMVNDG
jgi:hypothetical protein